MIDRILADTVVVVHLLFVLYVAFGSLFVFPWPRTAWLHLPAVVWGAVIELAGWPCPLTPLEQRLRRSAGDQGYDGGFIEHYVVSLIYPGGLTRTYQILLGIAILAINGAVYVWVWRRSTGGRKIGSRS